MQFKDELKRIVRVAPTMDPTVSEDFPEINPETVDPEAHYLKFMPPLSRQSLAVFMAENAPGIRAEIVAEDEENLRIAFYDGERRIRLLGDADTFEKGHHLTGLFTRLYAGLLVSGYTQEEISARFPEVYKLHRVDDFIFECENVVAYGSVAAYEASIEEFANGLLSVDEEDEE